MNCSEDFGSGNIELIAFTSQGFALAQRLAEMLGGTASRCGESESLAVWTARCFGSARALVFVGAVGIAVRAVASHIKNKASDPAVVAVDECAHFAVPILSGHLGGANDLARRISEHIDAIPVVTTATDVNGVFAVDEWAKRQNCVIPDPGKIKSISARLLAGGTVTLRTLWPVLGNPPSGVVVAQADGEYDFALTIKRKGRDVLRIVPRIAVLGVGCKEGTSREAIEEAFSALLAKSSLYEQAVYKVCSIDRKEREPGLLDFCRERDLPFVTFTPQELQQAQGNFTPSAFVQRITGVDNVCERAAVLGSGGKLSVKKAAGNGVTLALALSHFAPNWSWR